MASVVLLLLFFAVTFAGWSPTLAEENADTSANTSLRVKRGIVKMKLCYKYGICLGNSGYGGHGGYGGNIGYGGYQGYNGYQGNQGPIPINIAISQSQSSANEGGGGFGSGYYPNNYQYNGHNGYNQGYGYNAYNQHRPGFDNGNGAYNSQFNGNFYSGNGGYNQRPFGFNGYRDSVGDDYGNNDYDDAAGNDNYAYARSSATAIAGDAESRSNSKH